MTVVSACLTLGRIVGVLFLPSFLSPPPHCYPAKKQNVVTFHIKRLGRGGGWYGCCVPGSLCVLFHLTLYLSAQQTSPSLRDEETEALGRLNKFLGRGTS